MDNKFGKSIISSLKHDKMEWGLASAYFVVSLVVTLFRGDGIAVAILPALGASLMVFAFTNGLISFLSSTKKISVMKLLLCLVLASVLLGPLLLQYV